MPVWHDETRKLRQENKIQLVGLIQEHHPERALLVFKTEVIDAFQASRLNRKLVDLANRQTHAADEALRLSEANLQAGAMTTLDVLQAQDAVAQARLRHAESVVRYNQSQVNLLAAIGLLSDPSTGLPTSSQ